MAETTSCSIVNNLRLGWLGFGSTELWNLPSGAATSFCLTEIDAPLLLPGLSGSTGFSCFCKIYVVQYLKRPQRCSLPSQILYIIKVNLASVVMKHANVSGADELRCTCSRACECLRRLLKEKNATFMRRKSNKRTAVPQRTHTHTH